MHVHECCSQVLFMRVAVVYIPIFRLPFNVKYFAHSELFIVTCDIILYSDFSIIWFVSVLVALNYGVFRRKEFNGTVQYYMFYDMGATSTTATIVGMFFTQCLMFITGDESIDFNFKVNGNFPICISAIWYDRSI